MPMPTGVGALRQWLQEALLPGQATSRPHELVFFVGVTKTLNDIQ